MYSSYICPEAVTLGVGKTASANFIEGAAQIYGKDQGGEKGFWYFADERFEGGESMMTFLDKENHAQHYWALSQQRSQGPWNYTFVKGKGYVSFPDTVPDKPVVGLMDFFDKANKAAEKRKASAS